MAIRRDNIDFPDLKRPLMRAPKALGSYTYRLGNSSPKCHPA